MQNGIVLVRDGQLVVGTWALASGFEMRHARLKELVEKTKDRLEKYGPLKKVSVTQGNEFLDKKEGAIHDQKVVMNRGEKREKKRRGGQVDQFLINEDQYVCLLTILPNSEKCLDFKFRLADEFIRMRRVLVKLMVQRQSDDWLEKRSQGVVERSVETDAIKDFIEYARAQGSQSADKYYMIISKMENQSLINIELLNQKHDNVREMVDGFDLDALKMCDRIVAQTIRIGMQLSKHYKDIYKDCRDKVEGFSLAIGRTPLRLLK